ncbi:ABC transporter substrate-binding protein [Paenibacillus nuruki]|uniref:ABC transporter substrate-binding protein n=1 Tax=Paenibacillus nuruki TaxID=1886670 RepID=UPI002804F168|nr:ABC transporter substrate-binding protein [Paenibacillus nuruki]CAJ1314114.1 Iron-uptake system-binding protein [Paenibacillus nuruki]
MNRKHTYSVTLILLLSVGLLLSACSSGTSTPAPATSTENTATTESIPTERTLTDAIGNVVKVPANPQRVLASYLEDPLVALGVTPVAQWAIGEGNTQGYLQKQLANVPPIDSTLPYEAVLNTNPDLILMDSAEMVAGDKYAQYNQIAPTYVVGKKQNNDWREELLTIGDVLGKSNEAKKVLVDYEAKAKTAKDQLQQQIGNESAAALWVTGKNIYVVSRNLSSGDVLYNDLGLKAPVVVEEISKSGEANWQAISLEKLTDLDADYLFLINSTEQSKEEITSPAVWKNIPAVKKGHVYDFSADSSWLYTGAIANGQIIDDVLASVLQK